MLTLEELSNAVGAGDIDTVVVAFTDMQGRLMGKRMEAHFFLEEMEHKNPIEGCNYLLALEMEMDPVPGYEIASWERGYGDFSMVPDFSTMRRIPWLEGTALVLCDVAWNDGTPVRPSPRQVLKAQVERARALLDRFRMSAKESDYASSLSGGQKRLVEIMRALMLQPRLLLLDEPMSGVHPSIVGEIADYCEALRDEGLTILMVEHELHMIERMANPVVVMAQGSVIGQGTMAALRQQREIVDAYLVG